VALKLAVEEPIFKLMWIRVITFSLELALNCKLVTVFFVGLVLDVKGYVSSCAMWLRTLIYHNFY